MHSRLGRTATAIRIREIAAATFISTVSIVWWRAIPSRVSALPVDETLRRVDLLPRRVLKNHLRHNNLSLLYEELTGEGESARRVLRLPTSDSAWR